MDKGLLRVKELIDKKEWLEALSALDEPMQRDPMNNMALFMFGQILLETEKQCLAYPIYELLTQREPERPEVWINMGKAAGELHFYEDENRYFRKALKLAKEQNNTSCIFIATQNIATCAIHRSEPDQAIHWAKKALELKDNSQSKIDIGFANLAKFNFEEGWVNYNAGIGFQKNRDIKVYKGEPEWDGTEGKRVVIHGEQGLGDQIAFANCVKDARKASKSVILHVNKKLKNLFERSFVLETHGFGDDEWVESATIDASASLTRIQQFYRNSRDKYTGAPFLIADVFQRIQWRALLDELGSNPKVGIAWTGGSAMTQKNMRSTFLNVLKPILEKDITWISLEYKDRSDEIEEFYKNTGIRIYDFPRATQTQDYDDTAGLVAELDLVIAVPTSVVHLAGGLGVPCWCIVNPAPNYMFGLKGREMPVYKSVELFRREDSWDKVLDEIGGRLDEMRGSDTCRTGTREDTRDGSSIRSNSGNGQGTIHESRHIGC